MCNWFIIRDIYNRKILAFLRAENKSDDFVGTLARLLPISWQPLNLQFVSNLKVKKWKGERVKKWLTPQLQNKKYRYILSLSPLIKGRGELHNLLFYLLCGGCILSPFHLFTFSPLPFGEVRRGCKKLKPFYLFLLLPSFRPYSSHATSLPGSSTPSKRYFSLCRAFNFSTLATFFPSPGERL